MRCPHCASETPAGSTVCLACRKPIDEATLIHTPGTPSSRPSDGDVTIGPQAQPSGVSPVPGYGLGTMPPGYVFASRYRIDRLLGAGGMGAVYQVFDQALEVPVALKVIRPDIVGTPWLAHEFEQRFKQELLVARQVTHRNVVRIHDLGDSGGVKYITMQYVEGTSLAALIEQGRLPFGRVVGFAKQLAAGILAAHDAGVIHRDLKPQNILVDAADNIYISDFGLAKSLEVTLAGLTKPGEMVGTPRYISPEQIQGNPSDHRSDLYALGLILYEMVTGASPFKGHSAIELMYQRVQEPAPDPTLDNHDLPQYFARVIMRLLQRDPEARYQSARDVLADLEAEHAAPVASGRRSVTMTLPVPVGRSRMVIAAVVLAGVVVALPVARRYVPAFSGTATESPAPAPAPKRMAVLPFRVLGDQEALGHFAAGIEEALSAKLFQLDAVSLASAGAVQRAGGRESLAEIARDLGTPLLVAGTVRGDASNLRVTVTLDDAEAGQRVWAEEFSGLTADLLTIEDQIYNRLLEALDLRPSTEEMVRAVSRPTENVEAYQLYLRGRNAMRGQQNLENVQAAIRFYEQALEQDPGFARAYAGIADSALAMFRETKDRTWADRALSSAQQAQRLDEGLVEVHLALGSAYQATGRNAEAIAEFTIASELAPRSDDVFRRLARAYLATGRGEEAIKAYEAAVAVNPYYWVSYSALANAHLQLGDYATAAETLQRVIELEPENVTGHNDLGAAYLLTGRYDEAAASFTRALQLQPTAQTYTNLGIAYAYAGRHSEAIPMFEKAVELSPNGEQFIGNLGDGYRWAGEAEKAAAAYDKAIGLALKELQVNPRNALARGNVALYYGKKGDLARASTMIDDARAINPSNIHLMYAEATLEALSGRTPQALAALEEALKNGYPIAGAKSDPDLRALRDDPGFVQLASRFEPN